MDVEHGLICSIVEQGDIESPLECHIKRDFFADQKHLAVWDMIHDHWTQYDTVPTEAIVHRAYPNYRFLSPSEPIRYYITQVQDNHRFRLVADSVTAVMDEFESDGPDKGARLARALQSTIQQINTDIPPGKGIEWWDTLDEQLAVIKDRMANPGYLRGISTGFDTIDKVTGGLQPEQLITLTALPKAGKSSLLLNMALSASKQGQRVMFFTFEMSANEQQDRLSSLMAGVPLTPLLHGTLTPPDLKKVEASFALHKGFSGFTIVSDPASVTTVSALLAQVRQVRPHVVFVDGVYLMDDELGEPKMTSRALTNLTQALKRMAQAERIPMVVSTQSLASKAKGGLTADSIGYTSSFLSDSDVVLGAERQGDSTISKFKVMAIRSGPKIDTYVNIDWSQGLIEEVDEAAADVLVAAASNPTSGPGLSSVMP